MARPTKEVDVKLLGELAHMHCTWEEMCSILGVHRRTLERRYAHIIEEARSTGRMSLRRKRFAVALDGNVPMLIWLSKQILGEREKIEHQSDGQPMQQITPEELKNAIKAAKAQSG